MPRIRAATIDEHKAQTRRALLDSAKELIAVEGTAEMPLAEFALAAGIGRTTLYDYFSDRDDLIATMVEEELPGVVESIIAGVGKDGSPPERLAALAVRTVEFVVTDPVLGVILHREVGRMSLEAQERIRVAHSNLAGAMVSLYFQGVEQGDFRPMPPGLAGYLIQDTIMAAAKSVIAGPDPDRRIGEVGEQLRLYLLGGLAYRA